MLQPSIIWSRPLEFHETDAAGLAHFANYYHWMEAAEHALFKNHGIDLSERVDGVKIGWPRVATECQYLSPLRFGDVVEVSVEIAELKTRSIRYDFKIRAAGSKKLAAEGSLTAVCVALDQEAIRAIEIPPNIRKKLESAP